MVVDQMKQNHSVQQMAGDRMEQNHSVGQGSPQRSHVVPAHTGKIGVAEEPDHLRGLIDMSLIDMGPSRPANQAEAVCGMNGRCGDHT